LFSFGALSLLEEGSAFVIGVGFYVSQCIFYLQAL